MEVPVSGSHQCLEAQPELGPGPPPTKLHPLLSASSGGHSLVRGVS